MEDKDNLVFLKTREVFQTHAWDTAREREREHVWREKLIPPIRPSMSRSELSPDTATPLQQFAWGMHPTIWSSAHHKERWMKFGGGGHSKIILNVIIGPLKISTVY